MLNVRERICFDDDRAGEAPYYRGVRQALSKCLVLEDGDEAPDARLVLKAFQDVDAKAEAVAATSVGDDDGVVEALADRLAHLRVTAPLKPCECKARHKATGLFCKGSCGREALRPPVYLQRSHVCATLSPP
jgi:hypothetical protein